jgi:hypothetical protein
MTRPECKGTYRLAAPHVYCNVAVQVRGKLNTMNPPRTSNEPWSRRKHGALLLSIDSLQEVRCTFKNTPQDVHTALANLFVIVWKTDRDWIATKGSLEAH